MSPAVARASITASSAISRSRARPVSTAGSTPAPPAVGAATITPIAAFTSCTASARASTSLNSVFDSGPACDFATSSASPPTRPDAERRSPSRPRSTAPRITSSARRSALANVGDGSSLILALERERGLRERAVHSLPRRESPRRATCTRLSPRPCRARAPTCTHSRSPIASRAASPGGSSHSITMNASPPRSFRVRRIVARFTCFSARMPAMRATEPGWSAATSTIVGRLPVSSTG